MAHKQATDVLTALTGRTNINNDNNDNNDNNLITSMIVPSSNLRGSPMSSTSLMPSSASPTPVPEELVVPQSGFGRTARKIGSLPPTWSSVKIDLFCNGSTVRGKKKLTIKVGIILPNKPEPISLTAQLNSPIRHIYRGVPKEDLFQRHWQVVKSYEQANRKTNKDLRGSKFYMPGKSGSIEEITAWVYQIQDYWCLDIIRQGELYEFLLDDSGSPAFQKCNGIATGYYGTASTERRWVSLKELGI